MFLLCILQGLLKFNQSSRTTAHDALKHIYFANYKSENSRSAHNKLHRKLIQDVSSSTASHAVTRPCADVVNQSDVQFSGQHDIDSGCKSFASSSGHSRQPMEIRNDKIEDSNYACLETLEDEDQLAPCKGVRGSNIARQRNETNGFCADPDHNAHI